MKCWSNQKVPHVVLTPTNGLPLFANSGRSSHELPIAFVGGDGDGVREVDGTRVLARHRNLEEASDRARVVRDLQTQEDNRKVIHTHSTTAADERAVARAQAASAAVI